MPLAASSSSVQGYSNETPPQSPGKIKRKRKPKVIPDAYDGPMDWEEHDQKVKRTSKEDEFEPLQPGQKRRRRKKPSIDSHDSNVSSEPPKPAGNSLNQRPDIKSENCDVYEEKEDKDDDIDGVNYEDSDSKNASFNSETSMTNSSEGRKETSHLSIAEINNSVEWEFPKAGEEYNFELKKHHVVKDNGKKVYQCDICLGLYKHMFSLKRHYLRNHINYKYISKSDMTNCLINLMQAKQQMKYKLAALADEKTFKRKPEVKNHVSDIPNNACDRNSVSEETDEKMNKDGEKVFEEINTETAPNDEMSVKECDAMSENVKYGLDESIKTESDIKPNTSNTDLIKISNDVDNAKCADESFTKMEVNSNAEDTDKIPDVKNELEHSKESKDLVDQPENDIAAKSNDTVEPRNEIKAKSHDAEGEITKPMPGLFRCYTCYLTFDDFEGIREHTQNHPEQMEGECFPCDLCSMRFNYKHNLIRHKKTHYNGGKYKIIKIKSKIRMVAVS